jgi:hypothetical protein
VYQWNDPTLPEILTSVIIKMRHSPLKTVAEISNDRPYIVLNRDSWYWQKVQWKQGVKLNRHALPSKQVSKLILLRDLRGGADGRVWMACSTSGRVCVLKFARFLKEEGMSDNHLKVKCRQLHSMFDLLICQDNVV